MNNTKYEKLFPNSGDKAIAFDKIHTEPEWAWSLMDQAHALGIPVFMKEDLVPIIGG